MKPPKISKINTFSVTHTCKMWGYLIQAKYYYHSRRVQFVPSFSHFKLQSSITMTLILNIHSYTGLRSTGNFSKTWGCREDSTKGIKFPYSLFTVTVLSRRLRSLGETDYSKLYGRERSHNAQLRARCSSCRAR